MVDVAAQEPELFVDGVEAVALGHEVLEAPGLRLADRARGPVARPEARVVTVARGCELDPAVAMARCLAGVVVGQPIAHARRMHGQAIARVETQEPDPRLALA